MRIFTTAVILISLITSGCATISSTQRISSTVTAKEFNSLASKYMDRPTFISLETMSDNSDLLNIQMDGYKKPQYTQYWTVRFDKKYTPQYISFITKYLDWESIAVKRGDILDKEIGTAQTWANGSSGYIKFGFYSANKYSHFLTLDFCAAGTCVPTNMVFDKNNAEQLRALLTDFWAGKINSQVDSSVYK